LFVLLGSNHAVGARMTIAFPTQQSVERSGVQPKTSQLGYRCTAGFRAKAGEPALPLKRRAKSPWFDS
jgi:hypothetical protein